MLAGMAFDTLILALCLGVRVVGRTGVIELHPLPERFLAAVAMGRVLGLLWQTMLFLRTDLYAVLVNGLGCVNLYRTTYLWLLRRVRRLNEAEARELAEAHPRDLQVVRWFGWLYLFLTMFIPGTVIVTGWVVGSLRGTPMGSLAFWEALTIGLVGSIQMLAPLFVYPWERIRERRGLSA